MGKHKSVMFFSVNKPERVYYLDKAGLSDILISYLYIKKHKRLYMDECVPLALSRGGLFMVDSGAHTFQKSTGDDAYKPETWKPFIEEYVQFLHDNKSKIFCAANLDLENLVGEDVVNRWNQDYFEPLLKDMDIVFVSHDSPYDPSGLRRFKEYMKAYDYIGINQEVKNHISSYFSLTQMNKKRVHGFAWTSLNVLRSYPMFSVDSTSWTMGERYGASYFYDGKNFRTWDKKQKWRRKVKKVFCEEKGIDRAKLLVEDKETVYDFNLQAWVGFCKEYYKYAEMKLWNKPTDFYKR